MIQSLSISNFQSHKESSFDFSEGVNVIVGSSDSGKSSVLRALNWLINNKPSGDSFRSNWGGDTSVQLQFYNQFIERIKSNKENFYEAVWDLEEVSAGINNEEIFKAFGADVPQPIKEFLNFNEINFQFQLDSPFLLSNTAGEVARYLNSIVNLDIIDKALTKIETGRKKINRDISYTKNQLEAKLSELKKFDYLKEYEKKVETLEIKSKKISTLQDKYSQLYNLSKDYEGINLQLSRIKIPDGKKLKSLESKNKKLEALQEKYESLKDTFITYQKINKMLSEIKIPDEKKSKSLMGKIEQIEKLSEQHDELLDLLESYQSQSKQLDKVTKEWNQLQEQQRKLMPERCPLCGQRMPKNNVQSVANGKA